MPLPIPVIKFNPDGKPLTVDIAFPTLQAASYTLTLFEARSNSEVLCETGNNANPEDDRYPLPTPHDANNNRLLLFDVTFFDPGSKPDATCRAVAVVKQGSRDCGKLVVEGKITSTSFSGSSFARLEV